jgi:hypothetical protein
MVPVNMFSILYRVSWSIDAISSILTTMVVGASVLPMGGTAKMAEM